MGGCAARRDVIRACVPPAPAFGDPLFLNNQMRKGKMKSNLEKTTVRDLARLINTSCLTADASVSLEKEPEADP